MAGPSDEDTKMSKEPSFASQVQEFNFCGESIDISLRKLLAKVLLPKEAQQIDRAMEDFAKRYYECNPGLVDSPDVVYAVSFSILLLHTDAHNKNVKQKMNKDTFIMRTKIIEGGEGVAQEILDVMYDNIVMSEFTYADGRKESIGPRAERSNSWFSKLKSSNNSTDTLGSQNAALLADLGHKLEQFMPAENTFSYKRTLKPIPIMEVHFSLLKAKPLCLAGVRSRYGDSNNNNNTNTATNNTFTIRVTKAGILDRKYDFIQGGKKATARGWRPFGIILSGSQIIFFADIQSYQNWLDEEEQQTKGNVAPRRNNSFPAFSSITESTSDLSVNHATVNSISSLYPSSQFNSTTSPIPNTTSTTSTTTTTTTATTAASSYLRPVQIVSLSYAICICDESYTKYPHVFRLITGDGQQFLLRADNDEDMEDWMLKINYAATLKTTGVRMRPTKRPLMSFDSFHTTASATSSYTTTTTKEQRYTIDRLKREDKAKEKVQELSDRIDEQVKLLDRELQLRRNLMVLVPLQKSTKDRILSFAEVLGKRIRTKRIELQRLECYRDYLECELAWCLSQHPQIHQSNSNSSNSNTTSRKLSLPLPTHLYSFSSASSSTSTQQQQQQQQQLQVQQKQNVKKLANLVFTDPSDDSSPISTSTSTSSLRNSHPTLENSSVHSSSNQGDEDDEEVEDEEEEEGDHSSLHSGDKSSLNTTATGATTEATPAPQLPAFAFPKSFIENISFMDKVNVKSASDKAVEMDRVMRRRSQSNPILPNKLVDKKLLLPKGNRARSGSEASSVKEDDDDMSVIMVNDSEEMLVESSSWPTSVTTEEPQDIITVTVT